MKFLIFLLNIPFFLIPHSYENIVHLGREKRNSFQAILSALWNTKCFVINNKYLNNSTFVNDKEMNYWYKNLKKSFFFKPIIYELNHYRICIFYRNNLRILFSLKNRKEICIIVGSFRSVNQDSRMAERNGAKSAMNAIFGAIDDEIPFFYPRLDYTRCSELWRRSIVVNLGKGNEFRLFVCQ